ncbi:uncharacterized protein [Panulirus ornatus]
MGRRGRRWRRQESQSTIAMASISTHCSILLVLPLLAAYLQGSNALAAGAFRDDTRLSALDDGEPSMAGRQGQIHRQEGYYHQPQSEENHLAYVLPALFITGISLLFPNFVTINSRRRRRNADPDAPMEELTQHLMNVYLAAVESDGCMQRVVCELGAVARNLKPYQRNLMIS